VDNAKLAVNRDPKPNAENSRLADDVDRKAKTASHALHSSVQAQPKTVLSSGNFIERKVTEPRVEKPSDAVLSAEGAFKNHSNNV